MAHHCKVVRDQQIREPELLLQVGKQVDHLGLNAHVEGAHRLVGDDQIGFGGEGAGDANALALPT